jgi:hypothetical protein
LLLDKVAAIRPHLPDLEPCFCFLVDGGRIAPGVMAIHCSILSPSNAYRHQVLKREVTCRFEIYPLPVDNPYVDLCLRALLQ